MDDVDPAVERGARCACCGSAVALHAGRPRVTGDGRIELECEPCARGERPVAAIELPVDPVVAMPRRRVVTVIAGASAAAIAMIALLGDSASERLPAAVATASAAAGAQAGSESASEAESESASEVAAEADPEVEEPAPIAPALPPMPDHDGEPIDDWYPVLRDWVHPVPDSPDIVPHKASRLFGAKRGNRSATRCGGGHCGVDLEGDRGQTVISVSWGKVVRIQHDDVGSGGRYVKIEHPDFVYTSYFHLDTIAPGLQIGDELEAGAPLGVLGRSGIRVSMPHLHFALELPATGSDGDGSSLQFIDPVPFLARATVVTRASVPDLSEPLPVPLPLPLPSADP